MKKHLKYFERIIKCNDFNALKREYIDNFCESRNWHYKNIDTDKNIVYYDGTVIDQSGDWVDVVYQYSAHNVILDELARETNKLKSYLDELVLDITLAGNSPNEFLQTQLFFLRGMADTANKTCSVPSVETSLRHLVSYFSDNYRIKLPATSDRIKLEALPKNSFFDIKSNVKYALLRDIYDIATDLSFIDDEVVTEEDFIEVLTGDHKNLKAVIRFDCQNGLVAHFIDSIQPLFHEFSYKKIEESGCFINKNGEQLKAGDLSTSKSRLSEINFHKRDKTLQTISDTIKLCLE